ncbi:uncharacterized protein LOC141607772 [Silene latifolia]|uniref:uncharacterized protein LOC141607772 n=1 Tax=Silene latifolia TaxID=37657 RepID=UPI003D7895C4
MVEPVVTQPPVLRISKDDVAGEINYWSSSVYCYVLGANPMSSVLTEFMKRVWQAQGVDKISFTLNGIFLVRFKTKEKQQEVLANGHLIFDNKPVIVKEWQPDTELIKHDIQKVPIWMKLYVLDVKLWGLECLRKISTVVFKCDEATYQKHFLGFARLMVEVQIGQSFPSEIVFIDENDKTQTFSVEYDWLPVSCMACKGIGHIAVNYRRGNGNAPVKKVWKPKDKNPQPKQQVPLKYKEPVQVVIQKPKQKEVQQTVEVLATPIATSISLWNAIVENRVRELGESSKSHSDNVFDKMRKLKFWYTVMYGMNKFAERESLWRRIMTFHSTAWGADVTREEIIPLLQLTHDCHLSDLKACGSFFTWNNKHEQGTKVYSRIDKALINNDWLDTFSESFANFMPEGNFDHCPCLIRFDASTDRRRAPFKYVNIWSAAAGFEEMVNTAWKGNVIGTPMFKNVVKLKALKRELKKLNKDQFSDIENLTKVTELALAN